MLLSEMNASKPRSHKYALKARQPQYLICSMLMVSIVQMLRQRRSLLSTTLLSHRKTRRRLDTAKRYTPADCAHDVTQYLACIDDQYRINTENTYRVCAGATLFEVRDPDPYAIDKGRVLGLRLDVLVDGQPSRAPFTLLLHRPYPDLTSAVRVYKHTIPTAAAALDALIAQYLPFPAVDVRARTVKEPRKQDLIGLVRELRRALVAWQRRMKAIEELQREFALDKKDGGRSVAKDAILKIHSLDAEGREVHIEWTGFAAVLRIANDGVVEGCNIRDADGLEEKSGQRLFMAGQGRTIASIGDWIRDFLGPLEET